MMTARSLAVLLTAVLCMSGCGGAGDTGEGAPGADSERAINMAVSEDPIRRFAFWAIQNGRVDIGDLDVRINYLPVQSTQQAYQTRQYDVVEIAPVNLALAVQHGLETRILSAGIVENDATVLQVPVDSAIRSVDELKGATVAIANATATSTILLRYVLMERYGLDAEIGRGDVSLHVTPPDAIAGVLGKGAIEGTVNLNRGRFVFERTGRFRTIVELSKAATELTGAETVQVLLATYPPVAERKGAELKRLNEVLKASVAYAMANVDEVTADIAERSPQDAEYVKWWLGFSSLHYGELMESDRAGIEAAWKMAASVGLLNSAPRFDDLKVEYRDGGRVP